MIPATIDDGISKDAVGSFQQNCPKRPHAAFDGGNLPPSDQPKGRNGARVLILDVVPSP